MPSRVLKFGGTSMGSATNISLVTDIIVGQVLPDLQLWVVVSAMSGVTNLLYTLIEDIRLGEMSRAEKKLTDIREKHFNTLEEIVGKNAVQSIWDVTFAPSFHELELITEGLTLLRDVSDRYIARIVYFGEIFSSLILVQALKLKNISTVQAFSRDIIRTDSQYLNGTVDMAKTAENGLHFLSHSKNSVTVFTGFAGGDTHNNTVLLDRGGSDYVATILGAGIHSDRVEIWTDVDGVYSSDPRKVKNALLWSEINYDVAAEMALSGAKVLHPKTISPVQSENIPVIIKNTFFPSAPGTTIDNITQVGPVGINITMNQTLFHFTDPTMCGAVGFIYGVLGVFARANISIDALSTSEISFTCSFRSQDVEECVMIECRAMANLSVFEKVAKVSILGKGFSDSHHLNVTIAGILESYRVHMISQNASGTNITIFVDETHATEILQKLHTAIFQVHT